MHIAKKKQLIFLFAKNTDKIKISYYKLQILNGLSFTTPNACINYWFFKYTELDKNHTY